MRKRPHKTLTPEEIAAREEEIRISCLYNKYDKSQTRTIRVYKGGYASLIAVAPHKSEIED